MSSETPVAVTGAEGFIGSHLVEALVASGRRVRAMVQYNSFASHGWLEVLPPEVLDRVEVVLGDVRDPGSVRYLVTGCDTVYHLAALIAIPYSYRAPRSYVDTNVSGTLNVLEAVRDAGTPRLVHTSTSETYGTARTVPISEDHPIVTQSPYSASKAGGDRLVDSYHASFGTPVVTLRPFNTFGPRQSMRAVIPTVIGQVAAGEREVTLGDLRPTRDFTFVRDTAAAFLAVGTALGRERGGPYLQRRYGRGDLGRRSGPADRQADGRGSGRTRGRAAAAAVGVRGDAAGLRRVTAARGHGLGPGPQPGGRAGPHDRLLPRPGPSGPLQDHRLQHLTPRQLI